MNRTRALLIAIPAAAMLIISAEFLLVHAMPDYRTAYLVDASVGPDPAAFTAIADAVGSAAQNAADGDSLSLRRFGGACGDAASTASVVGPGTGRAQQIGAAAHAVKPSGGATLRAGLLAAIDDFSGYYPLRGSRRNRIIVVTSHGVDACGGDEGALREAVARKAADVGVTVDFRFVGYRMPAPEQPAFARLAAAARSTDPRQVTTTAELNATLAQLTIPDSPDAKKVEVPSASPSPSPAALADGLHYVFIRKIDTAARRLTVDEFEFYTGQQAKVEEQKDGLGPDYGDDDYYSRNPDKATVDVVAAPDIRVVVNQLPAIVGQDSDRNITFDELAALVAKNPTRAQDSYFKLVMSGGRVSELHEIWRP